MTISGIVVAVRAMVLSVLFAIPNPAAVAFQEPPQQATYGPCHICSGPTALLAAKPAG